MAAAQTGKSVSEFVKQTQVDHAGPWKDFDLPCKNNGKPILVSTTRSASILKRKHPLQYGKGTGGQ